MNSDHNETWARDFDAAARAQRGAAGQDRQMPAAAPVLAPGAPQPGSQWLAQAKSWLLIAAACIVVGIIFGAIGAEANSPDLGN